MFAHFFKSQRRSGLFFSHVAEWVSSSCCVLLVCLVLSWCIPDTARAFPIEEWEKLDTGSEQTLATVNIQPGRPWKEPVSGMMLLWIPGGCFKMGSHPSVEGRDADEGPVHTVCLSGFWLGKRELTQDQWQNIMQRNPSKFRRAGSFPVENISRMEVETFAGRLNAHYRGQVVFNLPTEAQWEYACRQAGTKVTFSGYDQIDQLGWYQANSAGSTRSTGSRAANRLGLLDMSGNVWEWVRDTYDKAAYGQRLAEGIRNNPLQTGAASFSVIRGGGWGDAPRTLRCANRGFERLSNKRPDLGARLVAVVDLAVEEMEVQEDSRGMPF